MFSVIIPVYNEESLIEENTKKLIKFMNKLKKPYEIILANNGSTDKTLDIAKHLSSQFSQVKYVSVNKRGAGLAFKKALSIAKYENIISQDMDISTDLNFIPKSLKLLENYDIVIGAKRVGNQKRSIMRKLVSSGYIFLTWLLLNLSYKDYSLAAKAYKKKILLEILNRMDSGTAYVIEAIYYAKLKNKKIIQIPVNCDDKRKSKFNLVDEILYRFFNLFRILYNYKIKNLFRS